MRVGILLGAMVVVTGAVGPARAAEHTTDPIDVVKAAVAEGKAILLDVREKGEWDDGHLRDARLLPLSTLRAGAGAEAVARVVPKGKIVYCHCGSGVRCLRAADALRTFGYDVRPLKPGYMDLLRAGFAPAPK